MSEIRRTDINHKIARRLEEKYAAEKQARETGQPMPTPEPKPKVFINGRISRKLTPDGEIIAKPEEIRIIGGEGLKFLR